MYEPKLKYKPETLYKSDINDLVEEEMEKGGPGSGIKGHRTEHQPHPGSSVSVHDAKHMAAQQSKEEAHLRSPEGEKERQERNKKMAQKMKAKHEEEDKRTESQKMADMRSGGPGFKRPWK